MTTKKDQPKPDVDFKAPAGYSDHLDHFTNFFDAIRSGKPIVEDAAFGFRAAAPCLACNDSYFEKKIINWDPVNMKLVKGYVVLVETGMPCLNKNRASLNSAYY